MLEWRCTPPSRPPKFVYQRLQLPNGLTVILNQDRSTPIVNVQLWYHVGSKDEKPGRTGFAHFFEHLMFKGSRNVEPEQHTSIVASVGGQANAYTNEDTTVFWQTVPSQFLPLVLWMEGDRMATLRIEQETFVARARGGEGRAPDAHREPAVRPAERDHLRAGVHDAPLPHPVIGSMDDLNAATIADVRDFYATYYVPSNVTVVISGDFDVEQTIGLVNQYFGRVPKALKPVPRDIPREPPQKAEKRRRRSRSRVPLPAVVVGYHITYDGHPDSYPLHILAKVLSDGQSSRIYRKLVYDTGPGAHRVRPGAT